MSRGRTGTKLCCLGPRTAAILLVCVAGLGGCTHAEAPSVAQSGGIAVLRHRSLADPGLALFLEAHAAASGEGSWSLNRLSLAALYFNPQLDNARAQLAQAVAARTTAGQRPNPVLNVNSGVGSLPGLLSPWILGAVFDVLIEGGGRRKARLQRAALLSDSARFNLAQRAWQVRSQLRQSLLAVYVGRRDIATRGALAAAQQESVRLLEATFNAGGVSSYEVAQSRIALDQTRQVLSQAAANQTNAMAQLAQTIGIAPRELQATVFEFSVFDDLPPAGAAADLQAEALLNRPDILAALADYAAARAALGQALAGRNQDIRISPGYEYNQGDRRWLMSAGIALPIFNRNQGQIAEAAARCDEAAAKVDQVQLAAIAELDAASQNYRTASDRVDQAKTLEAELANQLRIARARVAEGEASRLDLAQRQVELANAIVARNAALASAQAALGRLEDALQKPFADDALITTSFRKGLRP